MPPKRTRASSSADEDGAPFHFFSGASHHLGAQPVTPPQEPAPKKKRILRKPSSAPSQPITPPTSSDSEGVRLEGRLLKQQSYQIQDHPYDDDYEELSDSKNFELVCNIKDMAIYWSKILPIDDMTTWMKQKSHRLARQATHTRFSNPDASEWNRFSNTSI